MIIMNENEVKAIVEKHQRWLNHELNGECAVFDGADLSYADFSNIDLRCASFNNANLKGASFKGSVLENTQFKNANLNDANFSHADAHCANFEKSNIADADFTMANLSGANLSNTYLNRTNFKYANLSYADINRSSLLNANLSYADMERANLNYANLKNADFNYTNLILANLNGADISGAIGLMPQWEFIKSNFESTADGIIAYKTFDGHFGLPKTWKVERGSVITENVNFHRTDDCGCGINVATLDYIQKKYDADIWKVLIRWEWLAGVCVPYNSNGAIRCERCELLEIAEYAVTDNE